MISMCSMPEEAAAEAEAERDRAFRLKRERCVVELQLFKCVAQVGILGAVLGVDAAEYHRACRAVAGQRLRRRGGPLSVTVSPTRVSDTFLMLAVK